MKTNIRLKNFTHTNIKKKNPNVKTEHLDKYQYLPSPSCVSAKSDAVETI